MLQRSIQILSLACMLGMRRGASPCATCGMPGIRDAYALHKCVLLLLQSHCGQITFMTASCIARHFVIIVFAVRHCFRTSPANVLVQRLPT